MISNEKFWKMLCQLKSPWSIRKIKGQYWVSVQLGPYKLKTIKNKSIARAVRTAIS